MGDSPELVKREGGGAFGLPRSPQCLCGYQPLCSTGAPEGKGPPGRCRPGWEQTSRFIEAAVALSRGMGEGLGPPQGPGGAGPSPSPALRGQPWTHRDCPGSLVPSSAGSVCLQPAALFLHLLGHHQQHLAQALSQRGCQEGPGQRNEETEAQEPGCCLQGKGGVLVPCPSPRVTSPSPDTVLVPQDLGRPQLGVQVVVDAVHLAEGHPVPPA